MSEAEYISILKAIVAAEGAIIIGLIVWSVKHFIEDRSVRVDLQKCKDALGINGKRWGER